MSPLHHQHGIIEQANVASELLLASRFQESVRVSRGVLDAILPVVKKKPDHELYYQDHDARDISSMCSVSLRELPPAQALDQEFRQELDTFWPCQAVSFFDCQSVDKLEHPGVWDVFVSSLLYNIALSHHLQGLRSGSDKVFRKALALYGMAAERLTDLLFLSSSSSSSSGEATSHHLWTNDLYLLLLAALHNTTHISAHAVLDPATVEASAAQSVYVLSTITTTSTRTTTTTSSVDEQRRRRLHDGRLDDRFAFFYRNVRLCRSAVLGTAPAA